MKKTLLLIVMLVATLLATSAANLTPTEQTFGMSGVKTAGKTSEVFKQVKTPRERIPSFTKNDFIFNPEGTHSTYTHFGDGMLQFWGNLQGTCQNGSVMDIVTDGETVYIKHFFSIEQVLTSAFDYAYIKGTLDENTITVSFPQVALYWEDSDEYIYVSVGKKMEGEDETGKYYYYVEDTEDTDVTFTRDENGIWHIEESLTGPDWFADRVLGLFTTADGSWIGFAEWNSGWKPFDPDTKVTALPEDGQAIQLDHSYTDSQSGPKGAIIEAVIKDNKIYIPCMYYDCAGSCYVGEINGDKVTFASNQYLGLTRTDCVYNFCVGTYTAEMDGDQTEYVITPLPDVTLDYDAETNTISSPQNIVFFINYGDYETGFNYWTYTFNAQYFDPFFKNYEDLPATPANPSVFYVYDNYKDYGYVSMTAEIPNTGTDGKLLLESKQYYKVYVREAVDSEPEVYVLTSDKYPQLIELGLENLEEVPYDLNLYIWNSQYNYNESQVRAGGNQVNMYIPMPAAIGIQSIYYGGGERRETEIQWKVLTEGVDNVASDGEVTIVKVYDISGVERSGVEPGLNIVRMSDGSVRKVFVK